MFGNIVLRQNLLSHIVGGLVSQRDMGMCGGGRGCRVCTLLCVTSPAVNWWTSQSRWESGTDLSSMCHLCSQCSFQTQNPDFGVFFTRGGVSAFGLPIRHTHIKDIKVERNIFDPHMCFALHYNYAAF